MLTRPAHMWNHTLLAIVLGMSLAHGLSGAEAKTEKVAPNTALLITPGTFAVGCNYWASHAGTAMWRDWRQDVVDRDFALLASHGVKLVRVFPLWPDFQPVSVLREYLGKPVELRIGEHPLADGDEGRAGLSPEAMQRFQVLADLARKYDIKLIVALVNGWMSGRLFVPPALEGRNMLTDPLALQLEQRFVTGFVRRFRDHPAIAAWDLGNESDCTAECPSREAAWVWTSAIAKSIRCEDTTRPVWSGVASLNMEEGWTVRDQAELTDALVVHPYPPFVPHGDLDPALTFRTLLLGTAQSRFQSDIGGRPCVIEETGTLGPMVASDSNSAQFLRANLFSAWAHDCRTLLWWCAFDQEQLVQAPYDWNSVERELGLFRSDGRPKPVVAELAAFQSWQEALPFRALPPRLIDACCLLTQEQDHWGVALSSFLLAKQAGLDVAFRYVDRPIPKAPLYLVPSIKGMKVMPRRRWQELLGHVAEGSVLYLSFDGGYLSGFEAAVGMRVSSRQRLTGPVEASLRLAEGPLSLSLPASSGLTLEPVGAEVLGRTADGHPVFTKFAYGKGMVYFLGLPLESALMDAPGAFYKPGSSAHWKIYREVASRVHKTKAVTRSSEQVGLTEHPLGDGRRVAVLINYGPQSTSTRLELGPGWAIDSVLRGSTTKDGRLTIPGADAAVLMLAPR